MSESLSKPSDNLKAMGSHRYLLDHLNQFDAAPPRRIQVALPDLNTNGRVCFYGYEISREWLIDYSNEHMERAEECDDSAKVSGALFLLRGASGIKKLEYELALPDPKAAISIPTGARYQGAVVRLLSIFSNEVSSFPKRPRQEKVDRLSEILGGKQPKWWVDAEDPRSYYD